MILRPPRSTRTDTLFPYTTLFRSRDVFIAGVMEHIEEAGIHSGDSACSLPPYSLAPAIVEQIGRQTEQLARALGVVGLMNVQFAVRGEEIYILEVNPRASQIGRAHV